MKIDDDWTPYGILVETGIPLPPLGSGVPNARKGLFRAFPFERLKTPQDSFFVQVRELQAATPDASRRECTAIVRQLHAAARYFRLRSETPNLKDLKIHTRTASENGSYTGVRVWRSYAPTKAPGRDTGE